MARPAPSNELAYLRLVMYQETRDDDPNDIALSRYRQRMIHKPEWIHDRLLKAEKEYRDEVAAWERDNEEVHEGGKDLGTERCLAILDDLIKDLTK